MYMYLQKLRNTLRHTFSMAYPTYCKEFQCELAVYKHKSICAIVLCPPTHKHATIAHSKPSHTSCGLLDMNNYIVNGLYLVSGRDRLSWESVCVCLWCDWWENPVPFDIAEWHLVLPW